MEYRLVQVEASCFGAPRNWNGSFRLRVHSPSNFLDDFACGSIREEFNGVDRSASRLYNILPDNVVHKPIGPLHKDIGDESTDQLTRRIFVKQADIVDNSQGRKNDSSVFLFDHRPIRAFQARDGTVCIESDNQDIPLSFCFGQVVNMTPMNYVETPVGENNAFPLRFQSSADLHEIVSSEDFAHLRDPI
jgi:hypothetical protein